MGESRCRTLHHNGLCWFIFLIFLYRLLKFIEKSYYLLFYYYICKELMLNYQGLMQMYHLGNSP